MPDIVVERKQDWLRSKLGSGLKCIGISNAASTRFLFADLANMDPHCYPGLYLSDSSANYYGRVAQWLKRKNYNGGHRKFDTHGRVPPEVLDVCEEEGLYIQTVYRIMLTGQPDLRNFLSLRNNRTKTPTL